MSALERTQGRNVRAGKCKLQPQCCRANAYTSTQQSEQAFLDPRMLDGVLGAVALQPSLFARMLMRSCCPNVLQPRKVCC